MVRGILVVCVSAEAVGLGALSLHSNRFTTGGPLKVLLQRVTCFTCSARFSDRYSSEFSLYLQALGCFVFCLPGLQLQFCAQYLPVSALLKRLFLLASRIS